jgi:hypothetical protein
VPTRVNGTEYQHLTTACEVLGPEEKPFSAPERPIRKSCVIPSAEGIVDALIRLTFATKLDRMIVAGPKCVDTLLELHRRGYLRVTTAALCDVPCGQFDVALLAWREHSVEAFETTLNGLAHFLSAAGFLVVCVTTRDRIQLLGSALKRLGFRIEARTECEIGVTLCARRAKSFAPVA